MALLLLLAAVFPFTLLPLPQLRDGQEKLCQAFRQLLLYALAPAA
jgi:hypothetical protein